MPILGLHEFEAALARVAAGAENAAKEAVAKAASIAEAGAKRNFEGAHKKGEPHVGGEHPNIVTGTLRRSIRTDPIRRYALGDYGTIVAPRVNYARRVELGYPGGGGGRGQQATRPFPYFTEPAKHAKESFREIAAERWRHYLHG